jgi:tight adherence protein C
MRDLLLQSSWRVGALIAVFLFVVLLVFGVSTVIESRQAMRRRMEGAILGKSDEMVQSSLRSDQTKTAWTGLIDAIERQGISLVDTNNDSLRAKLIAAGYSSTYAPRWFTLIRLALTLGLPALFVATSMAADKPPSALKLYLIGAFVAILGLYMPNLWVSARASRRQEQIINGFPDALDLMLVCVEAGLGLEAAFDRVGREMSISHPLVSDMLGMVVLELRAGRSREEALRRMADRSQVDEIRSFSTLLIQSDKLGSSIATTLRIYASEMREKRRMRAEEKAHRLPVLLSVPLVACMLPVMIGVLMLPAAIRVARSLLPALSGG